MKKILIRTLITVIVGCIIIAICRITSFNTTSDSRIARYKRDAFEICNDGLREMVKFNYFSKIQVKSPSGADMDLLYTGGIKYLTYPDLLKIELTRGNSYEKIIYKDRKFIFYNSYPDGFYIEITPNMEKIVDILSYQYKKCIDIKIWLIDFLIMFITSLIVDISLALDK